MNKVDFESSLKALYDTHGVNCLTPMNEYDYAFFSWHPCHCCQRHLGGNRTYHAGFNPTTKEIVEDIELCDDCTYFNAYGELPG